MAYVFGAKDTETVQSTIYEEKEKPTNYVNEVVRLPVLIKALMDNN